MDNETNILKAFFNIQTDKHGPELLYRLNTKMEGSNNMIGYKEDKPKVKMELEVEQVIQQEIKDQEIRNMKNCNSIPDSESPNSCSKDIVPGLDNNTGGGNCITVAFADTNTPLLLTSDKTLLHMPHISSIYHQSYLPARESIEDISPQPEKIVQGRLVSVIQRAPSSHIQSEVTLQNLYDNSDLSYVTSRNEINPKTERLQNKRKIYLIKNDLEEAPPHNIIKRMMTNKADKTKKCSNQQQSDHLICEVCGEKAGKHSYYGGQVCPSCRAFFRRSVQSNCNEIFTCIKGDEKCEITLITRKNCQFCRFQCCLKAGMKQSWILSDEERMRRFKRRTQVQGLVNIQSVNQSKSCSKSPRKLIFAEGTTTSVPNPYLGLNPEDGVTILRYGEVMKSCCSGDQQDYSSNLLTDIMPVTFHGTRLSHQTALQLHNILETRTRTCFSLFHEFQILTPFDQQQLVMCNAPLIHRFRQAVCLSHPHLDWKHFVGFLVGEDKLGEVENIPHDLSANQGTNEQFHYRDLLNSPWRNQSKEEGLIYQDLVDEISKSVDYNDEIQMILMTLIIAFNPLFLDLEERTKMEDIQLKFVLLLQSHLCVTYPSQIAAVKLTKMLMVPVIAREIFLMTKDQLVI